MPAPQEAMARQGLPLAYRKYRSVFFADRLQRSKITPRICASFRRPGLAQDPNSAVLYGVDSLADVIHFGVRGRVRALITGTRPGV